MTIREFRGDDLDAICEAWNAVWPHLTRSKEQLLRDFERLEPRFHSRFLVAEIGGKFVGFAEILREIGSFHPRKWTIYTVVPSANREQGIGSALYHAASQEVLAQNPISIASRVHERDVAARRFAANRGFSEKKRDFESSLAMKDVDVRRLEEIEGRSLPEGVRLTTLAKSDTPEARRAFFELFEGVRNDIPRSEPPTPMDFDFFDQQVLGDPAFLAEATGLALDAAGEPIGFCGVFQSMMPNCLDQWLTAVRKDWRGQGIAFALKVQGIRWAMANGIERILTDNDTRNEPMLTINDRLGFQREEALITLSREFGE